MSRRLDRQTISGLALACLLLFLPPLGGCMEVGRASSAGISVQSQDSQAEVHPNALDPDSANSTKGLLRGPSLDPMIEFLDHTNGRCPPDLLTKAGKILGGRIIEVWDASSPWPSKTKTLYLVTANSGKRGIFMVADGGYIHVNSRAELLAINEILREHAFTRRDFNDIQKVDLFLSEVMFLHHGPSLVPGSSLMLRMTDASRWLRGTEKNEAILRELCEDPQFSFEGEVWSVVFNAFKPDGSVDQWKIVGEHHPEENINQILGVEVIPLKPPGTFSNPLMG